MEEFVISDGCGMCAAVLPEKGGTVVSLSRDGKEFLYRSEDNLASAERPRCGIPVLFPIFGKLNDDRYELEGKPYSMGIHGFAHTSHWYVAAHSPDALTLVLEANRETLKQYPFRFRLTLRYRVSGGGLTIGQCYENLDERPMPFSYGLHPYFRLRNLEEATVEVSAPAQLQIFRGQAVPADFGTFRICDPGEGSKCRAVLRIPSEGREVSVEFDERFPRLVLWTLPGMPFLCVEPVNGTQNGFNEGVFEMLSPGEKRSASVRICPKLI